MILLFSLIIITSILTLGFTIVSQEGMALYKLREWAENKNDKGSKWVEPLFLCIWCMPSIWSSFGFFFAYQIGILKCDSWNILWYYPLCVGGSSILGGLIWTVYLTINSVKERNKVEADFSKSIENKD